jgi:hypothetical protein
MKKVLVVLVIFSTLFTSCIDEVSGSFQNEQVEDCDSFKVGVLAKVNSGEITFAQGLLILKDSDCARACTPEQQAAFDEIDSSLDAINAYLISIGADGFGETTIEEQLSLVGLGC